MKIFVYSALLLLLIVSPCTSETQEPLCPKHIETPTYPAIGRTAQMSGKVVMAVTIDADGKVDDVKVTSEKEKFVKILEIGAVANIRLWTFANPLGRPRTQTIIYDFTLDESLPGEGGPRNLPAITKVSFDLPDRVTIRANLPFVETSAAHSQRSGA